MKRWVCLHNLSSYLLFKRKVLLLTENNVQIAGVVFVSNILVDFKLILLLLFFA